MSKYVTWNHFIDGFRYLKYMCGSWYDYMFYTKTDDIQDSVFWFKLEQSYWKVIEKIYR